MALAIGWVAWGVVAFLALAWAYACRNAMASGEPPQWSSVVLTLFWWVVALAFLFSHANKLHILWAAPAPFVLSFFVSPPMGIPLLSPVVLGVAQAFVTVVTLGVKKEVKGGLE